MTQIIPQFPECPPVAEFLVAARARLAALTGKDYATVTVSIDGFGELITISTYVDDGTHCKAATLDDSIRAQIIEQASPARVESIRAQATALTKQADAMAERYAEAKIHQQKLPNIHD